MTQHTDLGTQNEGPAPTRKKLSVVAVAKKAVAATAALLMREIIESLLRR